MGVAFFDGVWIVLMRVGVVRLVAVWGVVFLMAPAAAGQVSLQVDSLRSGINAEVEVATAIAGDTDSDSTGLSGTIDLVAGDQTVRITGGTLNLADGLRLKFSFGLLLGSITATADSSDLRLEILVAGPQTDLIDGAFSQSDNVLSMQGVLLLKGSGAIAPVVPSDPQNISVPGDVTFAGTLESQDGVHRLTLPIEFSGSFDLGDAIAHVTVEGIVHASNATPSATERPAEPPPHLITELYPHPVRHGGRMALSLDRPEHIRIDVYDVQGRRVAGLADAVFPSGRSELSFDVSDLAGGVYLVRVTGASVRETVPLVVVR